AKRPERVAEIVLRRRPSERHALAGVFRECRAIGFDRLLEPGRAALALAKGPERVAEIVLRHGPIERHALARAFRQCRAKGFARLLEPGRAALALAKGPERVAEIVLRHGPIEWRNRVLAESKCVLITRDRLGECCVITKFVPLVVECARLVHHKS